MRRITVALLRPRITVVLLTVAVSLVLLAPASALAVTGGPQWTVTAVSAPTDLLPGDESGDQYFNVIVTNSGGESSTGPVTITDTLPEGVTLDHVGAEGFEMGPDSQVRPPLACEGVSCTFSGTVAPQDM